MELRLLARNPRNTFLSNFFLSILLLVLALYANRLRPCTAMASPTFRRGLVPTKLGLVHYTSIGKVDDNNKGNELPIVGFHMSPRSVDEYKEIMSECHNADSRMFLAVDEFGYGQSDSPSKACTLEEIADCFLQVLDALDIQKCIVAGSLMGCYFALSLASRYPDRIAGVVCSNLYYFQKEAREKAFQDEAARQAGTTVAEPNSWELKEDGSHIGEIWPKRSSWLTPELNTRATLDNLVYLIKRRERYAQGIHIQDGGAFPLEETCRKVTCPVLCINGEGAVGFFDMIGMNMSGQFKEAVGFFPNLPDIQVLEKGSINMLNEYPKEWFEMVQAFVKKIETSN